MIGLSASVSRPVLVSTDTRSARIARSSASGLGAQLHEAAAVVVVVDARGVEPEFVVALALVPDAPGVVTVTVYALLTDGSP
jgi:hypothetical protein